MFMLTNTSATACLNAILNTIDAGSGPAKIYIFSGAVPGDPSSAVGFETALATLTCADPVGAISGRDLVFSAIPVVAAAATGTASFFRLTDSDDNILAQGSVSDNAGSGDLKLSSVSLVATGDVEITSAKITF
jgi:hypothetical protein